MRDHGTTSHPQLPPLLREAVPAHEAGQLDAALPLYQDDRGVRRGSDTAAMNQQSEFAAAFERARKLHAQGRLAEAERAYRQLHGQLAGPGEHRETVLKALVDLYSQAGRGDETIATLRALTEEAPDRLHYYAHLANLLDSLGQTDTAIDQYLRLLQRQPEMAAAHFNLALLYKKAKRYADAVASYEEAARLGIGDVQEVWSNLGVLYSEMHQAGNAAAMYERALEVEPLYIPALFNRAGLHEEAGERDKAIELYRRIRSIDPGHCSALARLAYAGKVTSEDDGPVDSLREAIDEASDDALAREELYFALGKSLDDLGRYDDAFAAYGAANALGKVRNPPYDRPRTEQAFGRVIELFDFDWLAGATSRSAAAPIFICGMFRSGSTLVEQVLAAHPSIVAGGELDFLPWLVARKLSPFPDRAANASRDELKQLGDEYLSKVQELFPDAGNVTDKRPDNFLHLGLVKAMFPSARIIYTKRDPLDNCLSVYFQQLGGNLGYATDLDDTAHYYRQHERLMTHWNACFPENILTVDYDEMVRSPEPVLRRLLAFLGLHWDDRCLAFQHVDSPAKTASVWQVREELHARSSGRWRNYEAHLGELPALIQRAQDAPLPQLQLALALRETGDTEGAVRSLRRAVAIRPDFSDAWLALADLLTAMADKEGANQAFGMYIRHSKNEPRLVEAAARLRENRSAEAAGILRSHLQRHPNDVCALCMLADLAQRQARLDSAESLLQRCLELAPGYRLARHNYAVVLMRQDRPSAALREIDALLADAPANADAQKLKGAILLRLGEYEAAIDAFERVLGKHPEQPAAWASLGHALRTVGRTEECIEAYRKAAVIAPQFGEAYWNLANLKTYRITDLELEAMQHQLEKPRLDDEDRFHFHCAVGKALEDRAEFGDSFRHYAAANRLRRRSIAYDPDDFSALMRRSIALLTREFFAERSGCGTASTAPIFIVGLPRAGSTLVEQILGSHSAVEGTMELPHVPELARRLTTRGAGTTPYPEVLAAIGHDEFRELGREYLERTRDQRKDETPFFVDKMPSNFAHLGLIHLMLPNARIVDVRRHPLGCGMSLFKHAFASGQPFSYSLEDIGRYYRDYAELMSHFDYVMPARVHRVVYESLVEDTEAEVRRLLDYCGLAFEESCLRFFENRRAVSTPSSEQVRTPIFRDALDHWHHFEPWLHPLKAQVRSLIDTWPAPGT